MEVRAQVRIAAVARGINARRRQRRRRLLSSSSSDDEQDRENELGGMDYAVLLNFPKNTPETEDWIGYTGDVTWTSRPVLGPADTPSTVASPQPTLALSSRQLREARRRRPKASTSEQRRKRAQEKRAVANSARTHRLARRSR